MAISPRKLCWQQILAVLGERKADLVISDMAPNMSGMAGVDQPRAMYLVELASEMAAQVLKPDGAFLTKVFHGEGFDELLKALKGRYKKVSTRKPQASRAARARCICWRKVFKGVVMSRARKCLNVVSRGFYFERHDSKTAGLGRHFFCADVGVPQSHAAATSQRARLLRLYQEVQQQRVASVVIDGQKINGAMKDGTEFQTVRPNVLDTHLMDDLLSNNVKVEGREPEQPGLLQQFFLRCCQCC
jgi:hypothetical protein